MITEYRAADSAPLLPRSSGVAVHTVDGHVERVHNFRVRIGAERFEAARSAGAGCGAADHDPDLSAGGSVGNRDRGRSRRRDLAHSGARRGARSRLGSPAGACGSLVAAVRRRVRHCTWTTDARPGLGWAAVRRSRRGRIASDGRSAGRLRARTGRDRDNHSGAAPGKTGCRSAHLSQHRRRVAPASVQAPASHSGRGHRARSRRAGASSRRDSRSCVVGLPGATNDPGAHCGGRGRSEEVSPPAGACGGARWTWRPAHWPCSNTST